MNIAVAKLCILMITWNFCEIFYEENFSFIDSPHYHANVDANAENLLIDCVWKFQKSIGQKEMVENNKI